MDLRYASLCAAFASLAAASAEAAEQLKSFHTQLMNTTKAQPIAVDFANLPNLPKPRKPIFIGKNQFIRFAEPTPTSGLKASVYRGDLTRRERRVAKAQSGLTKPNKILGWLAAKIKLTGRPVPFVVPRAPLPILATGRPRFREFRQAVLVAPALSTKK